MSLRDFADLLSREPLKASIVLAALIFLLWTSGIDGRIRFARQSFMSLYLLMATACPAIYVIYPPGDPFVERVFALYSPHMAILTVWIASLSFFELIYLCGPNKREATAVVDG